MAEDVVVSNVKQGASFNETKFETKVKACESLLIKDDENEVDNDARNGCEDACTAASGSTDQCETVAKDGINNENCDDDLMMKGVLNAKIIAIIHLLSGKKYPDPSVFANIQTDGFINLSDLPSFDVEVFAVDGFEDHHTP